MQLDGRTIAITGAGRGLGAALAITAAERGARPVLVGRAPAALRSVADAVKARTGCRPEQVPCDLADIASCGAAAAAVGERCPDLDGLVHNGAMWLPGALETLEDEDMRDCVASAAVGALVLTRRLLPVLRRRPAADIHTIVSVSGLPNVPLLGASVAFRAAKAAQDGFVQGLASELAGTNIRVTAVHPGNIDDVSPLDPAWNEPRGSRDALTNREVVEAILFVLAQPFNTSIRSMVIERTDSDLFRRDPPMSG